MKKKKLKRCIALILAFSMITSLSITSLAGTAESDGEFVNGCSDISEEEEEVSNSEIITEVIDLSDEESEDNIGILSPSLYLMSDSEDISDGYNLEVNRDREYILPGESVTFDAVLYYWTNSSENGYSQDLYEGNDITYEWTLYGASSNIIESTSDNGASFVLTAKDDIEYEKITVGVEVSAYSADGTVLGTVYSSVTISQKIYELTASEETYYVKEGESIDVEVELLCHTLSGTTTVTSGVSYDLVHYGASWSHDSDVDDFDPESLLRTDGLHIEASSYPSGIYYATNRYNVVATIDDAEVATAEISVSVDRRTTYDYIYGMNNESCLTNAEYSISKESFVQYRTVSQNQGEYDYSYQDVTINKVTAVTDSGEYLEVREEDGYYILTPVEEGTVTVTVYYDPIEGSDDENNGQYSIVLTVSDAWEGDYLELYYDDGRLVPGQSVDMTAACIHYKETAEGYEETSCSGVSYEWEITDCYPEDSVQITPSDHTCTVTASSANDCDDGYAFVVVTAYDENGNYLDDRTAYIELYSEYYTLSMDEYQLSLAPGESTKIVPSVTYYSADFPNGTSVDPDDLDICLYVEEYYLQDEDRYIWVGDNEDDTINAVSINSETLEITALETGYSDIIVYLDMYIKTSEESDAPCWYLSEGWIALYISSDSVAGDCEHSSLTYYPAVKATCTTDGYEGYWKCNDCGRIFNDGEAANEISEIQVLPAAGHNAVKVGAKEATDTADGNIEYWYCADCGKYFSDESLSTEITLEATVISATGSSSDSCTDSLVVRRGNTYYFSYSLKSGVADKTISYGKATDEVLFGDWDGDGVDTICVRRGNAYYFSNSLKSGTADTVVYYGKATDEVLVGDWDGDGKDTLAVRRGNAYYISNTIKSGTADKTVYYGKATDTVLVGDWDGSGKDSLAVRRGNTYYISYTIKSGEADKVVAYGKATDEVLVGDWNGNGVDTLTVRRGNAYYISNTIKSGTADRTIYYGRSTDEVYSGKWN